MKLNTNINNSTKRSARGFTLIEMVGVLAVIAILAALLVPKIFQAINDSKLSSTVSTLNTCKTATMSYYAQTNKFTIAEDFDKVLMASNLLDSVFQCKVADSCKMHVVKSGGPDTTVGYNLDGAANTTLNAAVVECVLTGVSIADAIELSKRIDGEATAANALSKSDATVDDLKGRVEYKAPASGATTTDVYVYIAHK